jgi:hypothetical protein
MTVLDGLPTICCKYCYCVPNRMLGLLLTKEIVRREKRNVGSQEPRSTRRYLALFLPLFSATRVLVVHSKIVS